MKTILCCTDGSAYAQSVYEHTAWASRQTGASVVVVHMLEPKFSRSHGYDLSGNLGVDTRDSLLEQTALLEQAKHRLAFEQGKLILEHADQVLNANGVKNSRGEQIHGELVETVSELERKADLVVLGKRGEAADFAKLHLGSNLERVVRASIRPVLVASRAFRPIERCLIAYDGGPSIERGLEFLRGNPILKGVELLLLRAGRIDGQARQSVEEAASGLCQADYRARALAVEGDVEKVIEKTAKEEQCDLLAMGAYGHSRIRNLIIGSSTTTMIRLCQIPVLLFR